MTKLTLLNGTPLSPGVFGTMQFGGTANAKASQELFEACRHAGIAHFDTAVSYTGGQSETLLGKFIAPVRENIFLATKVGYTGGADAKTLNDQFDSSQRQLNTDFVDLLYLHRFDPTTPLEDTFNVLARLQSEGRIRYIGVSNYAAWQVMKANAVCQALGTRIDAIQPMFNLVKRQAEVEIFPMAQDQGIKIFPYSPLGGGLLTGKYRKADATGRLAEDERYAARYGVAAMHDAAAGLQDVALRLGQDPATLAVAWAKAHPAGISPIISARSVAQLAPSLAGLTLEMSEELYAEISALYPAPPPATDRLEESG